MRFLLLLPLLSGCVSASYHQRAVAVARYEELSKCREFVQQYENKEISFRRLNYLVTKEWAAVKPGRVK